MIPKSIYRLSEYKIIEDENGALWWEAHTGLGELKRGKCFTIGDILFIGAKKMEEPGFLKNEFLEKLKPLQEWGKTKYYCLSHDIRTCKSGRKLIEEEMQSWGAGRFGIKQKMKSPRSPDKTECQLEGSELTEVSYRLWNYEIVKKPNGQIWWKVHSGYNTLKGGKCTVAEDILFIGMEENEESGNLKTEFLNYLNHLPKWSATKYYCTNCVLYDCRAGRLSALKEKRDRLVEDLKRERPKNRISATGGQKKGGGKSDLIRWIDSIHWQGIKKWIAYIVVFFLTITTLIFAILIGFLNNKKDHHQKRNHPSSHHREH